MSTIPAAVAGFISQGRVGRLGTAGASGQPLVVPICYAFDGESLFSAIDAKPKTRNAAGLKRIQNIRENAKVSVLIDQYDEDWTQLRYVIIQGEARLLTDGSDFSRGADLLLAKYPQYVAMGLNRETGLMIKVTPARVIQWQFEPGRRAPEAGRGAAVGGRGEAEGGPSNPDRGSPKRAEPSASGDWASGSAPRASRGEG